MGDLLGLNTFNAFLLIVLGFGFLIFVHELGHFLVAKWVGIKVLQFAVGMGHALVSWRKGVGFRFGSTDAEVIRRVTGYLRDRGVEITPDQPLTSKPIDEAMQDLGIGETEYRLSMLPLGGYVKMLGQDDMDPTATSNDPRAFNAKPIWARACVISAGVVMNLIFGAIFLIAAFLAGVEFPPAIVGDVMPDQPAALVYAQGHENDSAYLGIQPGDQIIQINGEHVTDFMEVVVRTALADRGQPLRITVQREGEKDLLTYDVTPEVSQRTELLTIGLDGPRRTRLAVVPVAGPLKEAGLAPGMKAVAVDGQRIENYAQVHLAVIRAMGKPVAVTFADAENPNKTVTVDFTAMPALASGPDKLTQLIGMTPATRITAVEDKSPAKIAGIEAGDILVKLGTTSWPTASEVLDIVPDARKQGQPLNITVLRDGEQVVIGAVMPSREGRLGIDIIDATDSNIVGRTLPDSPAESLNLPGGSQIVAINNQTVSDFTQMLRVLQAAVAEGAASVTVRYKLHLPGAEVAEREIVLDEQSVADIAGTRWVFAQGAMFDILRVPLVADNPIEAVKLGLRKTHHFMLQTYITLARLFQGTVKVSHLRGPVGIAQEGTRIAQEGTSYLFFFLGVISINLVVINFLPIPIVDGGLMVLLLIEKLKGSPVSPRIQATATIIGLVLLGSLFLVVTFNDVSRLPFVGGN